MGKLFGTDGVRGVAGKDLTCELALQIGRATAAELTSLDGHRPPYSDWQRYPCFRRYAGMHPGCRFVQRWRRR